MSPRSWSARGSATRPPGSAPTARTKVFVADDPNLALYSSEGYAEAVAKAVETASPDAVFFAGTAMGRDLAPRVAAKLGVDALADVVRPRA